MAFENYSWDNSIQNRKVPKSIPVQNQFGAENNVGIPVIRPPSNRPITGIRPVKRPINPPNAINPPRIIPPGTHPPPGGGGGIYGR
jgi:hypothetical protein